MTDTQYYEYKAALAYNAAKAQYDAESKYFYLLAHPEQIGI